MNEEMILPSDVLIDGQTADMVGGTMDAVEEKVGLMLQAHKGYAPAMLDLRELALEIHNLRMLLAESGVYNPTVESGWLLKQRG